MAILAQLEPNTGERRRSARQRVRLIARGATSSWPEVRVVIHDLSVTGLLIETSAALNIGEHLDFDLPENKGAEVRIVWKSRRYFGCEFISEISPASVSAAMLMSPASTPVDGDADVISIALAELRALSTRVQQITDALDRTIDRMTAPGIGGPNE